MAFDFSAAFESFNKVLPLLQMLASQDQQKFINKQAEQKFAEEQKLNAANIQKLGADTEATNATTQQNMANQRNLQNARQAMGKFGQITTTPEAMDYYNKPEFQQEVNRYDQTPARQIPNIPVEDQQQINKSTSDYYNINEAIPQTSNKADLFSKLGNLQYMDTNVAINTLRPILQELETKQKQEFEMQKLEKQQQGKMEELGKTQQYQKQFWGNQINPETGKTVYNAQKMEAFDKRLRDSTKKETNSLKEYTSLVDLLTTTTDAKKLANGLTAFRVPRLSGEVGALTKTDQDKRFVESIVAKAEQAYNALIKGEMSPTNKNALLAYANLMKAANAKHALNLIDSYKKSATNYLGDETVNKIATPLEELFKIENVDLNDLTKEKQQTSKNASPTINFSKDYTKEEEDEYQMLLQKLGK